MPNLHAISDTHFQNDNIIKYCNRPFVNSDAQTERLVHYWNERVQPEDTVIHCGDFILGNPASALEILQSLNGHIILVRGNHDTKAKLSLYSQYPEKITVKDIHYESFGGLWFIFCHFPMVHEDFAEMVVRDNSEVVYVHGHVHDKTPFYTDRYHSFNVSVDVTQFAPVLVRGMFEIVRNDFMKKGVWRGR